MLYITSNILGGIVQCTCSLALRRLARATCVMYTMESAARNSCPTLYRAWVFWFANGAKCARK
eukprot:15339254-Heterocapsa_arctica.AAC.1